MIKYDNNNIGKFNEGATPILKAYKGGVMCFNNGLEGGTSTPSQVPCFWVTSDITHYEGSFEDVYDQTSEKWYKLNNLGEYEEYGIYGDTRNTTTYVGKLVIEDGYEYEWDGTEWVNLGDASVEYPKSYETKSAPTDNVAFSSFTEARSYECPWVLQKATIKKPTNHYYFNYQYEWVKGTEPTEALTKWVETGEEICYDGYLYDDSEEKYESYDNATWLPTGNLRPIGEAGESCGLPDNYIIQFADSTVKTLCVNNWGGNVYSGELTYGEAKAVTSLGNVFKNNRTITSFNELAFFGGLTALTNGEFVGCTNLMDIVIPSNVATLGFCQNTRNTFSGCSNLSGLTILSGDDATAPLLVSGNFSNNSYWMKSSHSSTPWVFPNRILTFEGCTFGYADYCTIGYFQSATPPVGLAGADISNYRKLATIYCPIGASAAYTAALNGLTKTVIEYDFATDPNSVLTKEKYWTNKLING